MIVIVLIYFLKAPIFTRFGVSVCMLIGSAISRNMQAKNKQKNKPGVSQQWIGWIFSDVLQFMSLMCQLYILCSPCLLFDIDEEGCLISDGKLYLFGKGRQNNWHVIG